MASLAASKPGKQEPKLTSRGALAKNESKRNRRHRKRQVKRASKIDDGAGAGPVIDMTEDTDDEGNDNDFSIEAISFYDRLAESEDQKGTRANGKGTSARQTKEKELDNEIVAGPSNSMSIKGKERERASPSPAVEEINTSTFKPMTRSIMSGWKLSLSPTPPPPAKRARTESPAQVELFIDEKPGPTASVLDPQGDADHFQPPGLFSTSLIPSKKVKRSLRREEQKQRNGEEAKDAKPDTDTAAEGGEEKLLLPEHVTLETAVDGDGGDEEEGDRSMDNAEGLHILDDSKARGVQRYFDPQAGTDDVSTFLASADQSRMCMNCKRPGHNQRDCPHILCPTCGKEDEHERRDCPYNLICFRCGVAGHKIQDCSKPRTKSGACERCGGSDHTAVVCPMIWRMYSYYTEDERQAVQEQHAAAKGWAKEAVGGREHERWCYNCAQEGHFGDDCPKSRGSLARFSASAFSKLSQSRGPFGSTSSLGSRLSSAQPTHQRWDGSDDEDDHKLPGQVSPFAGLGAGRKTVEKRKRAAMEQERQFGGTEPRRSRHARNGDSGAGGGSLPFSHRQFMTPSASGSGGNGNGNGSPAIRDRRPNGKPTSSAKIQFGKLSMPGDNDTPRRNTPGGSGSASASTTLVNRALRQSMLNSPKSPTVNLNGGSGNTSSPLASTPQSTSKRRRKKDKLGDREDGEIEEVAFRKSGMGGGKVEGWGRELDEEERKAKKVGKIERKRAKDENAGGGGPTGGGLSIKGRSQAAAPGQQYHGGY